MSRNREPLAVHQAKKSATHLLRDLKATNDPDAVARAAQRFLVLPYFAGRTARDVIAERESTTRRHALDVVAIEAGHRTWADLVRAAEANDGRLHRTKREDVRTGELHYVVADNDGQYFVVATRRPARVETNISDDLNVTYGYLGSQPDLDQEPLFSFHGGYENTSVIVGADDWIRYGDDPEPERADEYLPEIPEPDEPYLEIEVLDEGHFAVAGSIPFQINYGLVNATVARLLVGQDADPIWSFPSPVGCWRLGEDGVLHPAMPQEERERLAAVARLTRTIGDRRLLLSPIEGGYATIERPLPASLVVLANEHPERYTAQELARLRDGTAKWTARVTALAPLAPDGALHAEVAPVTTPHVQIARWEWVAVVDLTAEEIEEIRERVQSTLVHHGAPAFTPWANSVEEGSERWTGVEIRRRHEKKPVGRVTRVAGERHELILYVTNAAGEEVPVTQETAAPATCPIPTDAARVSRTTV